MAVKYYPNPVTLISLKLELPEGKNDFRCLVAFRKTDARFTATEESISYDIGQFDQGSMVFKVQMERIGTIQSGK